MTCKAVSILSFTLCRSGKTTVKLKLSKTITEYKVTHLQIAYEYDTSKDSKHSRHSPNFHH